MAALQGGLPWPLRAVAVVLTTLAVVATIWRCVLLRGHAPRSMEWGEPAGSLYIFLGSANRRLPAALSGCQRFGTVLWWLQIRTPEGTFRLMVDVGLQEPRAIRRLARRLFDPAAGGPADADAGRHQADTIRPKV